MSRRKRRIRKQPTDSFMKMTDKTLDIMAGGMALGVTANMTGQVFKNLPK